MLFKGVLDVNLKPTKGQGLWDLVHGVNAKPLAKFGPNMNVFW